MSITEIQPRFLYGLRTNIKNSAAYITDQTILYPVGSVLALHNIGQKHQYFIRLQNKVVNLITVSSNRLVVSLYPFVM